MSQPTIDNQVLAQCSSEPIRIPGTVQDHGVLLTCEPDTMKIVMVSENCERWFGVPADKLIGLPLSDWLEIDNVDQIEVNRTSMQRFGNPMRLRAKAKTMSGVEGSFEGIAHHNDGLIVLELEFPTLPIDNPDDTYGLDQLFELIRHTTATAAQINGLSDLANHLSASLKDFTGFDRVMVYRFADDGHGQVIGEAREDDMEPYLGLRYPASDVPAQARELYKTQLLRLVVDVDADSSKVVPPTHPSTGKPLDMSRCVLRSVSPIHLQYLRNMGVASTMTVSLINNGELWGLLACHHRKPRFVSYSLRTACELLASITAVQLAERELALSEMEYTRRQNSMMSIIRRLSKCDDILEGLEPELQAIAELFNAHQCLLVNREKVFMDTTGSWSAEDIDQIQSALTWQIMGNVGSSDSLPTQVAQRHPGFAGLLYIRMQPGLDLAVLRQPISRTVRWGGNPDKAVQATDVKGRLQPRKSFEQYIQTVDGESEPWTELDLTLAQDFHGMTASFVVQRLEALSRELKLRLKAESDLAASEIRAALAFEIPNLSFWEYDFEAAKIVSSHWYAKLGYDPDQMPDDPLVLTNLIHPDEREMVRSKFFEFLQANAQIYNTQYRIRHVSGEWRWIESRGRLLRDAAGNKSRIIGIHYNIDDLKMAQTRALAKSDELQSLVYAISHDLKSPLVTVKGFVGMLEGDLEDGDMDSARHDIGRIRTAAQSMSDVIDDLLTLSRLGRDGLRCRLLDLKRKVDDLRQDYAKDLERCNATLELREPMAPLYADPYAIKRALTNLVDNALRYACDEPDQLIEISCEASSEKSAAILSVRDTGPGIEKAYHEKIFRVFERLARKKEGSGIGLASVSKAAELHGGRAWVESDLGQGATFKLLIPYPENIDEILAAAGESPQ